VHTSKQHPKDSAVQQDVHDQESSADLTLYLAVPQLAERLLPLLLQT
jgi:hypothetical protein